MHDAGCLGLVHWDDPEGWYGRAGEKLHIYEDSKGKLVIPRGDRKGKRIKQPRV